MVAWRVLLVMSCKVVVLCSVFRITSTVGLRVGIFRWGMFVMITLCVFPVSVWYCWILRFVFRFVIRRVRVVVF